MSFSAETVLAVIDALNEAGCWRTIDGGWGVDALTGHQTRDHEDLDLVVRLDQIGAVLEALDGLDFSLDLDQRPCSGETSGRPLGGPPPGRVRFHGHGWQRGARADGSDCPYPPDGFSKGTIAGRTVPCLSAALQIAHHQGYEPDDKDRHDLELLCTVH